MTDSGHPLDPDLVVTNDDVVALNQATVLRAAAFARIAGAVLVGIGILGLSAWLWVTVREQQRADDQYTGSFDGDDDGGVDFVERIDIFASSLPFLMFSSIPLGGGFALRVFADHAVARSGGSLTGYEPGDTLPADADNDAGGEPLS